MKAPETQIAVTLFSVRDHCQNIKDFEETLKKVTDMGYQTVQLSAHGPMAPEEMKESLDKYNLYVCATHESHENLTIKIDETIKKLKTWECEFTALGYPPENFHKGLDGVNSLIKDMVSAGEKMKENGIRLGYHNHDFEFTKVDDRTWFEHYYEDTPADIIYSLMDVHWVQRGGGNPAAWIRRLKDRIPVIHFKDYVMHDGKPVFCEVGEGNLDWPSIIEACKYSNVRWLTVEQDSPFPGRDIFESLKMSIDNMKKMGIK